MKFIYATYVPPAKYHVVYIIAFWRHMYRVPLGKVVRSGNLPRIIEGIKRKYGVSDSNRVGDGPEPLHDYLDVSSVRE